MTKNFERVLQDLELGTSKLFSLRDLLPVDHPRAFDEAWFLARLGELFGDDGSSVYVLCHKPSDLLITAYSGKTGPSFGGGGTFSARQSENFDLLGTIFGSEQYPKGFQEAVKELVELMLSDA